MKRYDLLADKLAWAFVIVLLLACVALGLVWYDVLTLKAAITWASCALLIILGTALVGIGQ